MEEGKQEAKAEQRAVPEVVGKQVDLAVRAKQAQRQEDDDDTH
jgi:hypothetical protein